MHSLDVFQHESENYALSAGIHVDRESLLNRKQAQVVVRPNLMLNGLPASLSLLKEVRLLLTSTDHDGIASTKEIDDFKLFEDRESAYEFQVPKRLKSIQFSLTAQVQNLSQNKKINLAATQSFTLNEIDRTEKIEDLHFLAIDGNYAIDLLGKSGEPRANRPIQLAIKHRDFRNTYNLTLQTDQNGRVTLGRLQDIHSVRATGPQGTAHTWVLPRDQHSYHRFVHGKTGETILLPYMGQQNKPARNEFSLLELRGRTFVADRFNALSIKDGFIQIGDLPRGDYDLLIKESDTHIHIRLADGEQREGIILGQNRQLEQRNQKPLQIEKISANDEQIVIRMQNASDFSRVHVVATRFQPAFPIYANFSRITDPEPYLTTVPKVEAIYIAGRNIGDEYRYIIDRKYAKRFPSNLLKRPSLLLNPWAIRNTQTSIENARTGDNFAAHGGESKAGEATRAKQLTPSSGTQADFANLDFLPYGSSLFLNLEADEKGNVTIKRDDLGEHQQLHVIAVDPHNTVYRTVSLPEGKRDFNDLRLVNGLDPKIHFTEQKQISIVPAKGEFILNDITTSRFESYDSLSRVYGLFATLSNNAKLNEFSFILEWPKLTEEEKQTRYSKYACHELNFFIYKKDRKFFEEVVQPYLRNKRDKTFLDRWLVEEKLDDYLKPWNFQQLNAVEQILLSHRINGEQAHTSRHVTDLFDLIPPNIDRFNQLYQTALKGSSLDTKDNFGLRNAGNALRKQRGLDMLQSRMDMPANGSLARPTETPAARPKAPSVSSATRPANKDQVLRQYNSPDSAKLVEKSKSAPQKEADRNALADAKSDEGRRRALGKKNAAKGYYRKLETEREEVRQLYRKLDKTQEWVENNYYKLPIEQQNANLITVNAFWNDYASHDPQKGFYSVNLAEASRNFPEMMFALSMLDIPFESSKHKTEFDEAKMTLAAASPMIVFHKEIKPTNAVVEKTPILVSENFFRHGDRYQHVGNERLDKFITDEFLRHTVYGCQMVVTNPTSSRQKLDVLLQIPLGSIPVLNGQFTRSVHMNLEPFHTQTLEYYFYFPAVGNFPHYPVHVAKNEELIAHAGTFSFKVVDQPSKIDRQSWDFVSQQGTDEQVLAYLKKQNLHRINLERIAFRMQEKKFFETVVSLLTKRHKYHHTLWSYGIKHDVPMVIREYLQHADSFVSRCGSAINTPLLTIDPVVRKTYQHMDYSPLVNARAHSLGDARQILNDRFHAQYHRLLKVLSYRRTLNHEDLLSLTYYLLLQDRVEEALSFFGRINVDNVETRLQYDYFAAYLDLFTDEPQVARTISEKWLVALNDPNQAKFILVAAANKEKSNASYPVDHWRNAFTEIVNYLDDIEGKENDPTDPEDRTQSQTKLAETEPHFEFEVEAKQVHIHYQNLKDVQVNYYLMDIELLFSRNPFVQKHSGQFSNIKPNATQKIELPQKKSDHTFALPEKFHTSNVLIEIIGAGERRSKAYYSHSLNLQLIENYGQIRITEDKSGKPLSKVYVKVFAQRKDGRVQFYKDGYTDLRGRFDYTSLNTNELDFVSKFSLLVLSDNNGAVVREAEPPKR